MSDAAALGSSAQIRARLIGTWRAISMREWDANGQLSYPLGKEVNGQLIYTADGRMSANLTRSKMAKFAKSDLYDATVEERAKAWLDYVGYYGRFSIDEKKQAVIHHVEGSWFPNMTGSRQIRYFRLEKERLVLNADIEGSKIQVVWEKNVVRL